MRLSRVGLIGKALVIGVLLLIPGDFAVADQNNGGGGGGLSAQSCYLRDSNCTQFCGRVKGPMRYECFNRCDIYLSNCLDRGVWTDQPAVRQRREPSPKKMP
jgi:hypothetical protein